MCMVSSPRLSTPPMQSLVAKAVRRASHWAFHVRVGCRRQHLTTRCWVRTLTSGRFALLTQLQCLCSTIGLSVHPWHMTTDDYQLRSRTGAAYVFDALTDARVCVGRSILDFSFLSWARYCVRLRGQLVSYTFCERIQFPINRSLPLLVAAQVQLRTLHDDKYAYRFIRHLAAQFRRAIHPTWGPAARQSGEAGFGAQSDNLGIRRNHLGCNGTSQSLANLWSHTRSNLPALFLQPTNAVRKLRD